MCVCDTNFWKILGHCVKHGRLGILDPQLSENFSYIPSKAPYGELVKYLLGGSNFNYVGHRACVCKDNAEERKDREFGSGGAGET